MGGLRPQNQCSRPLYFWHHSTTCEEVWKYSKQVRNWKSPLITVTTFTFDIYCCTITPLNQQSLSLVSDSHLAFCLFSDWLLQCHKWKKITTFPSDISAHTGDTLYECNLPYLHQQYKLRFTFCTACGGVVLCFLSPSPCDILTDLTTSSFTQYSHAFNHNYYPCFYVFCIVLFALPLLAFFTECNPKLVSVLHSCLYLNYFFLGRCTCACEPVT